METDESVLDFEWMVSLARDNPAEFDRMRTKLIANFLASRGDSLELTELQQSIDANRCQESHDTVQIEELSSRMRYSFDRISTLFNQLIHVISTAAAKSDCQID